MEYIGLDPVNPLDTSASAAGTAAAASSGNLTTTAAKEMIVGAGTTSGLFVGGTNGFISRIITPIDGDIAADRFLSTAGTLRGDREPDGPCGVGHAGRGVPRRMTHRRNGSMQRLLAGLSLEDEDNYNY